VDECKPLCNGIGEEGIIAICEGLKSNKALEMLSLANNNIGDVGRGVHSSTFRLNVSSFCGIRWVPDFLPVY